MILDTLHKSLTDYGTMGNRIAQAIEWMRTTDPLSIPLGDQYTHIDGDRIIVKRLEYELSEPERMVFETHKVYIDIQLLLSGEEVIMWAPASVLAKVKVPYDCAKDVIFFEDPAVATPILLRAGEFAMFHPSDGHKGQCRVKGPGKVGKLVVKIAL